LLWREFVNGNVTKRNVKFRFIGLSQSNDVNRLGLEVPVLHIGRNALVRSKVDRALSLPVRWIAFKSAAKVTRQTYSSPD
jgi:hypothetical protein